MQKSSVDNKLPSYSMQVAKIKGIGKRIKEIVSSEKEKVIFDYNYLHSRQDLAGDYPLETIKVYYDGDCKVQWNFTLGYTGKNTLYPLTYVPDPLTEPGGEKAYLRLCLRSVQKVGIGGASEQPYEFSYNMGDPNSNKNGIPARFSFYHDRWGYSNSTAGIWGALGEAGNEDPKHILIYAGYYASQMNMPEVQRQVVDKLAQNGILSSIKYPTGGSLSFEYEQNIAFHNGNNTVMGGVRVSKTSVSDGIDQSKNIVTEYKYTEANSNSSGWGYETPIYNNDQKMTVHKDGQSIASVLLSLKSRSLTNSSSHGGGGSLPMPTIYNNGQSMGIDRTFQAEYLEAGEQGGFAQVSASFQTVLVYAYLAYELYQAIVAVSHTYDDFTTHNLYSDPLNGNNPLPFQYRRVVVSASLANNGKTVYEFTSPSDPLAPQIIVPQLEFPYSNKQRCAAWAYGLPKVITVYDKDDKLKKVTINTYFHPTSLLVNPNFVSQKWQPSRTVFRSFEEVNNNYWNSPDTTYIASDIYYPLAGHSQLTRTDEYLYNLGEQATVSTTKYEYNADYILRSINKTNSKGETLETSIRYPNDYTLAGAILALKNKNRISVPITTQTFITKAGGKYLLSGSVNEFGSAPNGDIKLVTNHQFENDRPVTEDLVPFNQGSLVPNTTYYKPKVVISYNAAGLPKSITANTVQTAELYDYENKFATASILNASADDVSYTSFEAENHSNWNYDQQHVISDFSPTGRNVFRFPQTAAILSSSAVKVDPTTGTSLQYTLSFWCKGEVPLVYKSDPRTPSTKSGITLRKTYENVVTGWKYYEYEVVDAKTINLSNRIALDVNSYRSFLIDEVRFYPSNARLQTTTYDPLIGKTSECDQNGRITYYSYDGMGRLKTVRDENRNVVKAYEYHTIEN